MVNDGGKGDLRRPSDISEEEVASNWELVFGNKEKEERQCRENTDTW